MATITQRTDATKAETISFDNLLEHQQALQYRSQKDRYVGDIDPVTKLRHGQGAYTYQENPYFQYQGSYECGIKQTANGNYSSLIMRDGSKYSGDFNDGEITGNGLKTWEDGKVYKGQFQEGEMHGVGVLLYGESKVQKDKKYEGQFHLNSREGQGVLTKKNGDVYDGNFSGNHPNGQIKIYSLTGEFYEGECIKGVMTGNGLLHAKNNQSYEGLFNEGKLNGQGKYFVKDGTYSLEGQYNMGVPEIEASKYLFELTAPLEGGEEADPNAKKDPKKAAPATPVEEAQGNATKISIDNATEDETKKNVGFRMTIVHQAAAYEDPNPPVVDEAAKGKKGAKDTGEPEIRMITPEPEVMEKEQGREFEIELGKIEEVIIPVGSQVTLPKGSVDELKGTSKMSETAKEVTGDATGSVQGDAETKTEQKWVKYNINQETEELVIRRSTVNGILTVDNLKFSLIPEKFEAGSYEIVITDKTNGISDDKLLEPMRIDLKIFDSAAEAEEAAAQAAAPKGGKKK